MKWILAFVLSIGFSQAEAGFLRLVPELQITNVEGSTGQFQIAGTVENQGDETAVDVVIEISRTGKALATVGNMAAGEKEDINVSLPEAELGISGEGTFLVPFRVLYKDGNRVSFSAPFIITVTKRSEGSALARVSPITLGLEGEAQKTGALDIGSAGDFELNVFNTSSQEIEAAIEFISSKELEFTTKQSKLKLKPGEEAQLSFSVRNKSALAGSSYASYAVVSGVIEGQAYSDYIGFVVKVTGQTERPWLSYLFGVLLIGFLGAGVWVYRRDQRGPGDVVNSINPDTIVKDDPADFRSNPRG